MSNVESKPFTLHISLGTLGNFSLVLDILQTAVWYDLKPKSIVFNALLIRGCYITRSVVDFSGVKASLILDGLHLYIVALFLHLNSTHKALYKGLTFTHSFTPLLAAAAI